MVVVLVDAIHGRSRYRRSAEERDGSVASQRQADGLGMSGENVVAGEGGDGWNRGMASRAWAWGNAELTAKTKWQHD